MRPMTLPDGEGFHTDVNELSALAVCTSAGREHLIGVGDEAADLFVLEPRDCSIVMQARLATSYTAPEHGSNFEGVAADNFGRVVIVTESPAGLVMLAKESFHESRVVSHWRVLFDEASVRAIAGVKPEDPLHPEGVLLLRDGHVLVVHEKDPPGLLEFGPPGDLPLGIHPGSYLPANEAFTARPPKLEARAWWPTPVPPDDPPPDPPAHAPDPMDDRVLKDVSDLAVWKGRLHLLSDQSTCIARLASEDVEPGTTIEFDAVWNLPAGLKKPEGLAFTADGHVYVGLDIKLAEQPNALNLFRFPPLVNQGGDGANTVQRA